MDFRRLEKFLYIITAAILVVVFISYVKKLLGDDNHGDFGVYLHAARLLLAGENIYTIPTQPGSLGLYYLYAPFTAVLFIPFTLMPIGPAAAIWTLMNMAVIWWIVCALCELVSGKRIAEFPSAQRWILMSVPIIFTGRFILNNLQRGQVNILELAVFVFALRLLHRPGNASSRLVAGIGVGISIALKLLTAPFLLVFVLRRKWLVLIGCTLGLALCFMIPALVIGLADDLAYHRFWLDSFVLNDVGQAASLHLKFNFSIKAQLIRYFAPVEGFALGDGTYSLMISEVSDRVLTVLDLGIRLSLIGSVGVFWQRYRKYGDRMIRFSLYALVFSILPLLFSTTQKVYFVFLLPAYFFAVYVWLIVGVRNKGFITLMLASFFFGSVITDRNLFGEIAAAAEAFGVFIVASLTLAVAVFRATEGLTRHTSLTTTDFDEQDRLAE